MYKNPHTLILSHHLSLHTIPAKLLNAAGIRSHHLWLGSRPCMELHLSLQPLGCALHPETSGCAHKSEDGIDRRLSAILLVQSTVRRRLKAERYRLEADIKML